MRHQRKAEEASIFLFFMFVIIRIFRERSSKPFVGWGAANTKSMGRQLAIVSAAMTKPTTKMHQNGAQLRIQLPT
jgi:hypothetical protein